MRWCSRWPFVILLAFTAFGQEPAPLRATARIVLVPTLVFSDKGRIVTGLEARDFSLFDNGVRQRFEIETDTSAASIAIAIQDNSAVRDYLPFVKKTGALIDSLLVGEGGRSAIVAYGDELQIVKPFGDGDSSSVFDKVTVHGSGSRMLDAGMEAVSLLKQEEPNRRRVLLFIGQASDEGSTTALETLKESAARENVIIHCLTLPIAGKKFIADTFSLRGKNEEWGGFEASVDLLKLVPAAHKGTKQAAGTDAFSGLARATGGIQIHFRKQRQLEDAFIAMGTAIRSSYLLIYTPVMYTSVKSEPGSGAAGYHALSVQVDVGGDKVYSRPGYWRDRE